MKGGSDMKNIYTEIQRGVESIRTKRQATQYKKLRRDTKKALLNNAKSKRLQQAKKEKAEAVKTSKPKKRSWRLPKFSGLAALTRGIPSDATLNRTILGTSSSKPSSRKSRLMHDADLEKLGKDILS